ncbi:Sorbin and SH3 domain-containing protein 2 [Physocladia obscura]|uniref:Sorbin and SH3 domain-containing protein 2 n=1 Tax=Physocladia obscura TaxID=109957 RepID=A0AAD5T8L4_9FUNG|nr:Sorbin and SH3 domain-containing protein 2 [Physocladia obscura]
MSDQCLSLSGSTACGALSGYTAYIEGQLGITDVASFDTYVENGVAVNGSFGGAFTTTFGCAGWTGAGLRYHQSALCAAFVGNAFVSGATGNATTCMAAARAPIQMCASVLAAFVASYRALLANASVCPDPSSTASAYLDFFEAAAPFLSTADDCLLGLAEDRGQCGFLTSAEERVYCASSNGTVDPCCSLLTVPSQISTSLTPTTTTTALNSNTTASTPSAYTIPIPVIASAAGSAVFLLTCIAICICIKTAKRIRTKNSDFESEDDENAAATESSGYTAGATDKKNKAAVAKSTAKNNRIADSSTADEDSPSVNESIRGENAAGKKPTAHAVVYSYYAQKMDELNAAIGDTFLVKERYDDGWGYGYNTRTHEEGFFPLGILSGFTIPSGSTPIATTPETYSANGMSINRISSLRGAPTTVIQTVPAVPRVPTNILDQQHHQYQPEYVSSSAQRSPLTNGPKSPLPVIPASSASPLAPQPAIMRLSMELNPPARSNKIAKVRIVMCGFEPELRDEIELKVGDQVQLLQEFDDGWGVGRNLNTGREGVLPLDCLNGYTSVEQQQVGYQQHNNQKHHNRESSLEMSCISLVGSTSCPSFAGYTGYLSFNATSVTEFDAYVEQSVTTDTGDAGTFASSMVTALGCTGWTGTGLRYHRTAVCGLLVYYAGQYGAGSTPCNASQAVVGADPLCAATMNSFLSSWAAVTANNASCPDGGDAANLQVYISGYDATLPLLQDAVGCVTSVPQDTANCGFTDAADAVAFCAATQTATCCATQSTTTSSATSSYSTTQSATTTISVQPSATASNTTSTTSSDTSVSITTIAGAAGGGFVLLVIIIVTVCCMRKKSRATVSDSYAFTKRPLPSSTSAASSYAGGGSQLKQQKSHRVVYDYLAQHPDEINCAIGDQIVLNTEYDDGWAFGLNTITKQEGYFPIEILQEFAQPLQNNNHKSNDYSQRSSSLYGGNNDYYDNNNTNSIYLTPSAAAASIQDYNSPNSKYQSTYTYATNNSVYDPIMESQPLEVAKIGPDEAVYPFDAERKDEVSLSPGDRVLVSKSFDDGWCYGTVLATQRTGYFPYDCLASYEREHGTTNNSNNAAAKKGKKARVSSIYDSESIYEAPQQQQPSVAADGSILVVYEFAPQNGDEVALRVGDRVLLKHEYDDGWAYGFNTNTKKEGILPLDCLASRDETSSTARRRGGPDRISTRISSLYGGQANTDSYYPQSNYGTDSVYY